MKINIVSMDGESKEEVVIIAKIRKQPRWLSSDDSVEREAIDVERREIKLLHLGEAELTQKDDEEGKEG